MRVGQGRQANFVMATAWIRLRRTSMATIHTAGRRMECTGKKLRLSEVSALMHGDCTICTATSGSCARIGMIPITTRVALPTAPFALNEAGPGATSPTNVVRPPGPATSRASASTASAFALPSRNPRVLAREVSRSGLNFGCGSKDLTEGWRARKSKKPDSDLASPSLRRERGQAEKPETGDHNSQEGGQTKHHG